MQTTKDALAGSGRPEGKKRQMEEGREEGAAVS